MGNKKLQIDISLLFFVGRNKEKFSGDEPMIIKKQFEGQHS